MRNFHDAFETRRWSFIGAFSICMTVPLTVKKWFVKKCTAVFFLTSCLCTCSYKNSWFFCFEANTAWKVSKYGVIFAPYFPVFGLNKERYSLSLRIQSEYRKIRTRNNSVFEHFSRSVSHDCFWNERLKRNKSKKINKKDVRLYALVCYL